MNKSQMHNEAFIKLTNRLDLSERNPEYVLTAIVDTIAQTLKADQVSLWQFTPFSMDVHCISASGGHGGKQISMEPVDLTPHTALVTALQTEFSVSTLNVAKDVRTATLPKDYWIQTNIKSCLHVPIRTIRKIQGILRVDAKSEQTWKAEDIHFCERVTDLVSQIMLTKELESAGQRARLLGNISSEITHRYNFPTMLNEIVQKCVETLQATEGALYLADPEQKMITCRAGYKISPKHIGKTLSYGEDVPGKVAETGMQMLIKDYRSWAGRTQKVEKKEESASIISIPIQNQGALTGVLQITRRNGRQSFQNNDREVVEQFASLASLAIEKHRLTEHTDRLKKFQGTMAQLIQSSNISANAIECMEASADYISHVLNVPSIIVRFGKDFSMRGLPEEADKLIEIELQKRSKQFDITIVAPDLESLDVRFPELSGFMNRMRLKACILKPIRVNHERNGFVFIATRWPRMWTPEEVGLVEVASQQIGLSIESIYYHQETRSYAELVKKLNIATSTLNRLVPLDELIPVIGQRALQLSNADKLVLILREQDGVIRSSWVFGMNKPEFDKTVEKDGEQILQFLPVDAKPISIPKIAEAPLPQMFKKQISTEKINSMRLTPIMHSGNVIGVIAACDEEPVEWLPQQRELMMTFANTVSLALQSAWYYEQLEKGYLDLALTVANTVDARENDDRASSIKVAEWSQQTAKLLGLSREEQQLVQWAAMFHNIGKVEVPEEVLKKAGPLNAEERKLIEQYPVKSEKLLSPLNRFREVGKALRYVRERFDGKGYPDKKKGEDIPLPSRILAVAGTYASMIESRPYRQAYSHENALRELSKNKGTQFDPVVVDAFLQAVSVQEHIQ